MLGNDIDSYKVFNRMTKLLRKDKIKSIDIVKKGLITKQKYKNINSNPDVAFFEEINNDALPLEKALPVAKRRIPRIYKYDPRDNDGLPLVIYAAHAPLYVYDPSPNSNYEITQTDSIYNISSYEYNGNELYSTTRSAPVMIWNTDSDTIFNSGETLDYTYNQAEKNYGSLSTAVDDSESAGLFRMGLRGEAYNDNDYFLVGTNTYLPGSNVRLPEYKPFYFFFDDYEFNYVSMRFLLFENMFRSTQLNRNRSTRLLSREEEAYEYYESYYEYIANYFFLLMMIIAFESVQIQKEMKRKLLPQVLMLSIDAIRADSFGEKYHDNLDKLISQFMYNYFGFNIPTVF